MIIVNFVTIASTCMLSFRSVTIFDQSTQNTIAFSYKMFKKGNKPNQSRLNLEQKVTILKKSDSGVSGKRLALDYNVSEAAISKIKKKRNEILSAVPNTLESANIKTLHKAEYVDHEKMFMNGLFLSEIEIVQWVV